MMLVDSHCHLNFPELSDKLPSLLDLMQAHDVVSALCVATKLEEAEEIIKMAETHPQILAAIGVHPEVTEVLEPSVEKLVELAAHPRVVGIGETGLDYYWHKDAPQWQRERFKVHIRAARETGKPLIIHNRDATADILKIMREERADQIGGVMHCFTENWDVAQSALDMNFYISFSGIVTFKNAKIVQEVALKTPFDRLLIETDSPYLAPVPFRGKTNQPAYVKYVAEAIAHLRDVSFGEIARATTENFYRLFGKNLQPTIGNLS